MKRLKFRGIDGEGIKDDTGDKYVLLKVDSVDPLINTEGLKTQEIVDFILQQSSDYILVGYGFGYDFENFLVDVTEEEYRKLIQMRSVYFPRFHCGMRMVPEKLLTIRRMVNGKMVERTIYNILHFFQTSFVDALKSFDLHELVNETIVSGKSERERFSLEKLDEIIKYNKQEVRALTILMTTFYNYAVEAFEKAQVPLEFTEEMLSSPGRLAKQLLSKTNWIEEHPHYRIPEEAHSDWYDSLKGLHPYSTDPSKPFLASYYGGRIEVGCQGKFDKLYMRDINSAYPRATSVLPKWNADDFVYTTNRKLIQESILTKRIGQYYVEWNFPKDWDYYPFPFRSKQNKVIFPYSGKGWIMSPELFAAIESGVEGFTVTRAIYLKGTEGEGAGDLKRNESTTAKEINKIYGKRLEFKAQKNGAEKPLKLVLNSLYGKTDEQEGEMFSDVAASWITSYTRAKLWRAIADHRKDHTVTQMMTDSVFSKVPLDLPTSKALGDWGEEEYYNCRILMPGIYDWHTKDGKYKFKIRGHSKVFDFDKAWELLTGQIDSYVYEYSHFIQHLQSYSQPNKYGDKMLQWVKAPKDIKPSLSSKREDTKRGIRIPAGETEIWKKPMVNAEAGKLFQQSLEEFL